MPGLPSYRQYEYLDWEVEWLFAHTYSSSNTTLQQQGNSGHGSIDYLSQDFGVRTAYNVSISSHEGSNGGPSLTDITIRFGQGGFPFRQFTFGLWSPSGKVRLRWHNARVTGTGWIEADTLEYYIDEVLVATTPNPAPPGTIINGIPGEGAQQTGCGQFPFGIGVQIKPGNMLSVAHSTFKNIDAFPWSETISHDTTMTTRLAIKEWGGSEYNLPLQWPTLVEPPGTGDWGLTIGTCAPGTDTSQVQVTGHIDRANSSTAPSSWDYEWCEAVAVPKFSGNPQLYDSDDYAAHILAAATQDVFSRSSRGGTGGGGTSVDLVMTGKSIEAQTIRGAVPAQVQAFYDEQVFGGIKKFVAQTDNDGKTEALQFEYPYQVGPHIPDAWEQYAKNNCNMANMVSLSHINDPTVIGAPAGTNVYWVPLKQQYLSDDGSDTRGKIVAEPFINISLNQWGVKHGIARDLLHEGTYELGPDSELAWSFAGISTTVFDSNEIEISDFTQSDVTVELELLSFKHAPWLFAAIAEAISLLPASGSFDSIEVKGFGLDGDTVAMGPACGSLPLPRAGGSHYAASWAEDHDPRIPGEDVGTDSIPDSGQSAELLDFRNVFFASYGPTAYPLILGGGIWKVQLKFVNAAGTIRFPYPHLHGPSGVPKVIHENANQHVIVWDSGAAVRMGAFHYTAGPDIINGPSKSFGGTKHWNAVDMMCFDRMVFRALTPMDVADDFVNAWGGEASITSLIASTTAWPFVDGTQLRMEMATSALPSTHLFHPALDRSISSLDETGARGRHSHSHCIEPSRIVCHGKPLHMFDPGGTQLTALETQHGNWWITKHTPAVTNDEDADYPLKADGVEFGQARPFHGYFGVLSLGIGESLWPANTHDDWGRYGRVDVPAGLGLIFHGSKYGLPVGPTGIVGDFEVEAVIDPDAGADIAHTCLIFSERRQEHHVSYTKDDGAGGRATFRSHSDDGGRSWSAIIAGMTGAVIERVAEDEYGGIARAGFVPDAPGGGPGTINTTWQPPGEQTPTAPVVATDETGAPIRMEDFGLDISFAPDMAGRLVMTGVPEGENDTAEWQSWNDGTSFKRI